MNKGNIKFY